MLTLTIPLLGAVITDQTAVQLTLVTTLVSVAFAAALFISRFVTRYELNTHIDKVQEQIAALNEKFDKYILKI